MGLRRVDGGALLLLLPLGEAVDGFHLFHLSLDDLSVVLGFRVVVVVVVLDGESTVVGLSLLDRIGLMAVPKADPIADTKAAATTDGTSTGLMLSSETGLAVVLVVVVVVVVVVAA